MPMQIQRNQTMLTRMNQNLANLEMSSISMVLNTPSILVTWFSIDVNVSEVIKGLKNVDDYIHPQSSVLYNMIEGVPMFGIDNLLEYSQYDTETARFDEDFSSSGVVYPNTVFPKPGDCFIIEGASAPALYVVTDTRVSTVKSNPFIEVNFRLFSRDAKTIKQLMEYQVGEKYETTMSTLGDHRSLLVSKKTKGDIEAHVNSYLDIASLYAMLFFDNNLATFVYGGMPGMDPKGHIGQRKFVDMTLWRFMFDEGIIIYDELVTYAETNFGRKVDRLFTSSPDIYVDTYAYKRSIIHRIYEPDTNNQVMRRGKFDEYRFPYVWRPTNRITKYQGVDIWYIDNYGNYPASGGDPYGNFYIWDTEFLCRIRQNNPYPLEIDGCDSDCRQCGGKCVGEPVRCINPYLRNAIIAHFNGGEIDWDGMRITDQRTVENFYLIPLVLGIYKKYIQSLQG